MSERRKGVSRREFLIRSGAAGIGSLFAAGGAAASTADSGTGGGKVPLRPFGRTGVDVPVLAMGGILDFSYNQLLLHQARMAGVTYWDTAESYMNGGSEEGIGKYFAKYPEAREEIFLVTKARARDPEALSRSLDASLARLNTDHVELFLLHDVSHVPRELNDAVRAWADAAKSAGKIRLFGFSAHSNMEKCLADAAGLGWIDGIMATYNYRVMTMPAMQSAVAACQQAGIGLTAMKTQAKSAYAAFIDLGEESAAAQALTERLVAKGWTVEQARLKAVWENPAIASICSQMPSLTHLKANAAAAADNTSLSTRDRALLDRVAADTREQYCAGCRDRCEPLLAGRVPVADVMRCLMYARGYNDHRRAADLFKRLPAEARNAMAGADYTAAEASCPHRLPIGRLMRRAVAELG